MSMFISKALRRAEVFLEQVDESVAQASRRLVVEGVTGAVKDEDYQSPSGGEENSTTHRRASAIPTAESRARASATASSGAGEPLFSEMQEDEDEDVNDGWDNEIVIDDPVVSASSDSTTEPVKEPQQHSQKFTAVQQPQPPQTPDAQTTTDSDKQSAEVPLDPPSDPSVSTGGPQSESQSKEPDNTTGIESAPGSANVQRNEPGSSKPTTPSNRNEPPLQSSSFPQISAPSGSLQSSSSAHAGRISSAASIPHKPVVKSAAVPARAPDTEFVQALQEENSDLRKELENVESELEGSRRDRTKLVKNLKRMKEIVSEMDESLRDKSAEARQLNDEILNLKEELSVLQKQQKQSETRGKGELESVQKQFSAELTTLQTELTNQTQRAEALEEENERLKEALLKGNEVDLATADGARREASQAHRAYEAEAAAHRQTRKQAKEREENLQEEAALAAVALAGAQRKAEECTAAASDAKSAQRAAESKLATVTNARDAAFARIEDLEESLRLYERNEGQAPGQREAKAMQDTVSDLETALEAKNVELTRLEGELEALRVKYRRDGTSPRTPGSAAAAAAAAGRAGNEQHDVEIKMRHMADAALRKQAQLEVLRSENRALQHQLTTERKRTREAQAMAAAASSSRQSIRGGFRGILDSGEDDRSERLYGLRDGPLARFRTPRNWPKPIAKMVASLDRFSAQALAFLRKEPLLRIVLIFYVVALHIFVYSLLHWHVGAVSGSADVSHGRIASSKDGVVKGAATK